MRDSVGGSNDTVASKKQEKASVTVEQAKKQGETRDYSNLREIMSNKETYDAFKQARTERIRNERIAKNPISNSTPIKYAQPSTINPPSEPDPVEPTPPMPTIVATSTPAAVAIAPASAPVKVAPIDTILFNEDSTPIEFMTDLIFENIGGHELINIARNDTINGQVVSYQPIQNLTDIQKQYNPNNIISLQETSEKYFDNFSIKLDTKIPNVGNGLNGDNVYLDSNTGNITVDFINLAVDEQVELEILTDGTIYEADI